MAVGVRSGPGAVAFLLMDVRIGTTLDGQVAGFDTSSRRPLLLVGDVGRGKTTTARYLARWWLADTVRHAHVFARSPSEWADQRCELQHPYELQSPVGRGCQPGSCLVVVDDIDLLGNDQLALLPLGPARTILTSYGGTSLAERALLATDVTCLGMVRPHPLELCEAAVLEGQGRLDWPIGTVPVVPDARGPLDFPCHRWQTPVELSGMTR